jgi:hypothetical protein
MGVSLRLQETPDDVSTNVAVEIPASTITTGTTDTGVFSTEAHVSSILSNFKKEAEIINKSQYCKGYGIIACNVLVDPHTADLTLVFRKSNFDGSIDPKTMKISIPVVECFEIVGLGSVSLPDLATELLKKVVYHADTHCVGIDGTQHVVKV